MQALSNTRLGQDLSRAVKVIGLTLARCKNTSLVPLTDNGLGKNSGFGLD